MATTQFVIANNVNTQLAAAASSSATTLTLASSANLPTLSAGQVMPLTLNDAATGQNYEIVYVTAITGVTLTVTRAQEGTGALTWNVGDYAFCAPTKGTVAVTTGNPSNTFMVANATAANMAPNVGQVQAGFANYAVATGTANAHTVALTPALTARTDGMLLRYKAPAANTGAVTLADGVGTANVIGANHAALQGGEYIANGDALVVWNSTINSGTYILLECTGGALQVAPATASQHAPQMAQAAGVVGSVRNLAMTVSTASATATLTADEIIVETALGGVRYCLPSFSKTINLSTTGAGGMDTGSAPVSGYVALYAIYNPTTNTAALLATNATSAVAPNIYGGGNMPSGYTASGLVSVWPTNGSGQFPIGYQKDRLISRGAVNVLSTGTTQSSYTSLNISSAVPRNALTAGGNLSVGSTSSSSLNMQASPDANGTGSVGFGQTTTGAFAYFNVQLATAQTMYYTATSSAGTPNFSISISSYTF
ncbi:hypothetical protein [Paraburkholderia tropica]|uniref:hypothetical protein n=1 Tax=Paraburkholderia tropica TaxID=92647 RepID=UPI003D2B9978